MPTGALTGALLTSAVTGAASAGASGLMGKLFGAGGSKVATAPVGINAGGLSGANGTLTPSAERLGLVNGIRDVFSGQGDALGALRQALIPGFSALRQSRLQEVENARLNAVGTLRDNMARRRVLGSSFGQDALVRAENEFGQQKDKVAAESFLQELEATTNLIGQETEARRASFQTGLDELNLEADLAAKLSATASSQMGAASRLEAELAAKSSAGAGKFFGETFKPAADALGKTVGSWFTPSSSANSLGGSLAFAGT